jgi:hypothetical protein
MRSRRAFAIVVLAAGLAAAMASAAGPRPATPPRREPIVLLDLNYTFVENQAEAARLGGGDFGRSLEFERYRRWLLDLVRSGHVILITARPERYRERTLARIDSLLGWQPDEAYFNERDQMPAVFKQEVLLTRIFPKYGRPADGTRYLAVESNPRTSTMYAGHGIPALRVWDDWQYGDSTRAVR